MAVVKINLHFAAVWNLTPCSMVDIFRLFKQNLCPSLRGNLEMELASTQKRWYLCATVHDVTHQKALVSVFTSVSTSDLVRTVYNTQMY